MSARIPPLPAGRQYPPPLAHTIRLHKALLGGRLDAAHAGGGCQLKRLSQCKGRYVLSLRQSDWDAAQALLAQLPPLTEVERRRQQRKEAAAAARAAAEAAAVSGGGDGGGGEQRRRAA